MKFPEKLWVEAVPDEFGDIETYNVFFQQTGYGVLSDGRVTQVCEYVPMLTLDTAAPSGPSAHGTTHELKSWPKFFEPILEGRKTFDLRVNDRDYQEGDCLRMREWNPVTQTYTGREHAVLVTYITGNPDHLRKNHVCLGISPLPAQPTESGSE